jgi:hypothetical protein
MSLVERKISDDIRFSRLSGRARWQSAPELNRALVVSPRDAPGLVVTGGVLTTNKWVEVNTFDVIRRVCRRLGIDFQRAQKVWIKYFRLTLQGHVPCSPIPRFLNEWDIPVVILLDESATGRGVLGL